MLLLFDIDGTLMRGASAAHAEALRLALRSVHGVNVEGVRLASSAAGRTDGEIARMYLLAAGVGADRIDALAADVQEECCRLYASLCPADLSHTVAPGMPELLARLDARDDTRLSLVTGNFEPVARIKLRAGGIDHWFERGQGGFGSDSEDRTMLPPIARRRAGEAAGMTTSWPRAQTLVIGDTPRDIACAHADSLRVIAITTGPHTREELRAAERVVDDTEALGKSILAESAAAG